jgi:6-phosphogluconolactonase
VTARPELIVAGDVAAEAAQLFLEQRPRTVALAGGSTPRALYQALAAADYDWRSVEVFFGDERCVPPDHPDSNFRMAKETLLSRIQARVHRMRGEDCDAAGYEAELRSVFGTGPPRFDVALLGLGEDGHTASLFPGDAALDESERWVVKVSRPDHDRLTLTLPVLSAAGLALFLVSGAEKRKALSGVLAGKDLPAARVAAERTVFVADRQAAPTGQAR